MPTYEYACTRCGHAFEQFQSMKDNPLRRCPSCKKLALKRLVGGGAGLIFKGSGFYITDYRKTSAGGDSGDKPKADAKPAAAKDGAASKSTKSEPTSKPAAAAAK